MKQLKKMNKALHFISILILLLTLTNCFRKKQTTEEAAIPTCGGSIDIPVIFKAKCYACHTYEKNTTGPAMKGLIQKEPSKEWFIAFITNQDSLVKIKDAYTLKCMQFSPVDFRHNFKELNSYNIAKILKIAE
jgi:hypothetical protein